MLLDLSRLPELAAVLATFAALWLLLEGLGRLRAWRRRARGWSQEVVGW